MPNMIQNSKIDGLIVMGQVSKKYIEALHFCGVPYIFLDFYDEHYNVDCVVGDSVYGSYILTNYLIGCGYRKIAFVGSILATSSILDRYLGYYKALLQNGIEVEPGWIIQDRDAEGNFIDLELPEDMPEAFVCNCDQIAYNLVDKLKQNNYLVPENIAVVGYDDFIYATVCNPPLTTFRVDMDAMGEAVVDAMIRKVADHKVQIGRKVISGKLVIRNSVGLKPQSER